MRISRAGKTTDNVPAGDGLQIILCSTWDYISRDSKKRHQHQCARLESIHIPTGQASFSQRHTYTHTHTHTHECRDGHRNTSALALPLLFVGEHGFWDGELVGHVGTSQILNNTPSYVYVICPDQREKAVRHTDSTSILNIAVCNTILQLLFELFSQCSVLLL